MLLGDANVEGALREPLAELVHAGAAGHGCGDGHHRAVGGGDVDERVGEDGGVGRSGGGGGQLLAGGDVELGNAVVLVRGSLRGRVALALVGLNVQQHRLPSAAVADVFKDGDQVVQVVAVDGPDVVKAELLEEGAAGHQPAGVLVDLGVGLLNLRGEELVDALGNIAEVLEGLGCDQAGGVRREGASRHCPSCRRCSSRQGDLLVVVVDDHDA
mmetsp:Transcript_12361/g.40588  ORF Transcript_12361/g.40588 Transcript_12361/m.40588 type:complete len:214 (-) Transcript_12361:709-1350(-)